MKRLLIIDDDNDILEALEALLSKKYEVTTVNRAARALELLASRNFDVILVDFVMPGLDGTQFLQRYTLSGYKAPVIFMTASFTEHGRFEGTSCVATIRKPFDVRQVESLIEQALARKG